MLSQPLLRETSSLAAFAAAMCILYGIGCMSEPRNAVQALVGVAEGICECSGGWDENISVLAMHEIGLYYLRGEDNDEDDDSGIVFTTEWKSGMLGDVGDTKKRECMMWLKRASDLGFKRKCIILFATLSLKMVILKKKQHHIYF